ncbi:MAG TPA: hypothetical protein VF952_12735 [Chloroflexia bacterium]
MSTESRRVCPSCGYEYEQWVEVCPDCNTPVGMQPAKLEMVRGQLGDDEDPRWTVVTNVPNAILGDLIKNQLEDAGIPVVMMRSPSADIAHFSHNDYVPHDIRVPFSMLREARQLVDSPPGGNLVEQDWQDSNAEGEEAGGEDEEQRRGLPQGWSVLPTESDVRARQMLRRSMGKPPEDWYWSDGKRRSGAAEGEGEGEGGSFWQQTYDRSATGPSFRRKDEMVFEDEYEDYTPYRNDDPYAPSKWVRWFYAILMLAISLPFIFQLLQTLFSFGQSGP